MNLVEHKQSFELARPITEVFPLFSPEGEKHWVPGWDYDNIMGTTELSEDYVFLTKNHAHGATDAIWLVKKYEPATPLVQYYKVEPDNKVGIVTVQCTELEPSLTQVEVTYKYIPISPAGEHFVGEFTAAAYEAFIGEWQILLSDHFATRPPINSFSNLQ